MINIKRSWPFISGLIVGCLATIIATLIWLLPSVSLKKHGQLVLTDFPIGINTVTFENDLVTISITDFTFQRDVPFEPNLQARCKDYEYGSIIGMPYEGHFFFQYENSKEGLYGMPPINDVNGTYPSTKIKQAQQGGADDR